MKSFFRSWIIPLCLSFGAVSSLTAQTDFWKQVRYFHQSEFYGGAHEINRDLVLFIDEVRHRYGKPIHINSGVRSIAHNKHIQGAPSSRHIYGEALDISATKGPQRYELIRLLMQVSEEWAMPIKVIVYRKHIHFALWEVGYLTIRE